MERDREDRSVLASWQGPETSGMSSLYMLIFMGALGVFFAVGIVVFLLYGFTSSASAGMDPLYLPAELWGSTLVLILTSWVMYSMERAARQGAYDAMSRWMHRTWGLSLLFVLIQVPALSELLRVHFVYVDSGRAGVYGITFALILLHALHVVGGMIAMGILFWRTRGGALGESHVHPARMCAQYWHFLSGLWAVLMVVFLMAS
jgi:cytochrome c oxidase subunit 3